VAHRGGGGGFRFFLTIGFWRALHAFHRARVTDTLFPSSHKSSKCWSALEMKAHVDNKRAIDRTAVFLGQLSDEEARRRSALSTRAAVSLKSVGAADPCVCCRAVAYAPSHGPLHEGSWSYAPRRYLRSTRYRRRSTHYCSRHAFAVGFLSLVSLQLGHIVKDGRVQLRTAQSQPGLHSNEIQL